MNHDFDFVAAENMHVLTVVLRSGEEPRLNRAQLFRVQRASRAYKLYLDAHPDSDDDEGPEDDDAWLYEDLILLSKLYARLKDREQLITLIFEVSACFRDIRSVQLMTSTQRGTHRTCSKTSSPSSMRR